MERLTSAAIQSLLSPFADEWFDLDQQAQSISIALYRLLALGEPVSIDMLCEATDLQAERVAEHLQEASGIQCSGDGRVTGYWGLSLLETDHTFIVGGRTLFTWCAWDSLFIPEILMMTARVESECPVTGRPIQVVVSPTGLKSPQPPEVVQSFIRPDPSSIRQDVRSSFCQYVHFFDSPSSGERWVGDHGKTLLLSLADAFLLGQMKNQRRYGASLRG